MRKFVLEMPEDWRFEINGHIFDVRKSDADILSKCAEFQGKYAGLAALKENRIAAISEAVNEVAAYIDEVLGAGAVQKISGGKPVSISCAINWLAAIFAEVLQHSGSKYISEKYE